MASGSQHLPGARKYSFLSLFISKKELVYLLHSVSLFHSALVAPWPTVSSHSILARHKMPHFLSQTSATAVRTRQKLGHRPVPLGPGSKPVGLLAWVEAHSSKKEEKAIEEEQEEAPNHQSIATQSQLLQGEQFGESKVFLAPDPDTIFSHSRAQGGISCSLLQTGYGWLAEGQESWNSTKIQADS